MSFSRVHLGPFLSDFLCLLNCHPGAENAREVRSLLPGAQPAEAGGALHRVPRTAGGDRDDLRARVSDIAGRVAPGLRPAADARSGRAEEARGARGGVGDPAYEDQVLLIRECDGCVRVK